VEGETVRQRQLEENKWIGHLEGWFTLWLKAQQV